jgi:outer membrane protein TolC
MFGYRSFGPRLRARLLGGLLGPGLLLAAPAWAQPPVTLPDPGPAQAAPAAPAARVLDLAALEALAAEKQPAIAAARASMTAAVARKQALDNLCVPTFLQRDLPTRRKQANVGLAAAQAGVALAENDTRFAVQYAYVSFLYASAQNRLADDILGNLDRLHRTLASKELSPPTSPVLLARIEALQLLASGRQAEATVGVDRALSSLREAVGVDGCWLLPLDRGGLLAPAATPDCKTVVGLALSRRPEITQASVIAEVTDLEVCAQAARRLSLTVWTYAAGSDLHANPLPTPVFGPNYRPGAVGPEMPVTINGKRSDRVGQAQIYQGRAYNVLEKTQGLIRLETEQAFLRWKEATARVARFQQGVVKAQAAFPDNAPPPQRPEPLTTYLDTARLLTDLRVELNRARYDQLLALVALERATAGGFCAGLENAPVAPEAGRPAEKKAP